METVIAGVEDSRESRDALRFARQFSDAEGAALHVVSVFADTIFVASLEEIEISRESYFKHMLEVAEEELEQSFEFHEVISTSVPAGLTSAAEELGAGAVVIGSSHRGPIGRVLMGDEGTQFATASPCSVIVTPRGWGRRAPDGIGRIGVAYNGTAEAKTALGYAAGLAKELGASLTLIGVVPHIITPGRIGLTDQGYQGILHDDMTKLLDEAVEGLGIDAGKLVATGYAADELAEASADLDLLVLGSRSYGPVRRVILGGTSVKVMRSSACPVVVVPKSSE